VKILYVSQYFPPENCAPAARVSELAQHWANNGDRVTVLTAFPNHPTGIIDPKYRKRFWRLHCRERVCDVDVVRTWLWPLPNAHIWKRVISYVSFFLSACVAGLFLDRPEVVIATSPQLLVGLSGWFLARFFGVPLVLEIRDLWPESMCAVGAQNSSGRLYRGVGTVAKFLYKRCDQIVVVTPAFREQLIQHWGIPASKIDVVENGVETELFSPSGPTDIRRPFALEGKFIVSYIGTIGMAHGLDTVLEAAELIRSECPGAHVLLIGEGAERAKVQEEAARRGLNNLSVLPAQPRETVPAFIRASDVCLTLLKKADAFQTVIPTKMLEFMSCARAVILGVEGQAAEILRQANAGICVAPENAEGLASAITALYRDATLRGRFGANGRAYILQHLTRAKTAAKYLVVLEAVLKDAKTKRRLRLEPERPTRVEIPQNAGALVPMKPL
jgi:glycosyltransferase involved in cell wall biosynthesis